MSLKVFMHPEPDTKPEAIGNGIQMVVQAMYKHLPTMDIELVSSLDHADLFASHVDSPFRVPDVLHTHGLYPTGEMEMGGWAFEVNARVITNARQALAVTAPSTFVADIFARNLGFRPKVIGHGIEPGEWPEPSRRNELTVLFNKNRAGDVCSAEPVERLAQLRPNVKFMSTFGTKRRNLEITGAMPHPAMKELLYKCGIYYAPTKETYGIGILEAMAAGMPVLTWDWGNNPELVRHMVDGYIVEPYDYTGTAKGLDWCIEHFSELTGHARVQALTHSWEGPIASYAALYRQAYARKLAKGPLVSVVIPCYNYGKYVAEAIQSVKDQTLTDWECIVVDDGSTDDSFEVAKKATQDDPRFTVITQLNAKVANTRNRGATRAQGKYLCFLDADDYMLPRCLEILTAALLKDRTAGIAYGRLKELTDKGLEAGVSSWPNDFNMTQQLAQRNQVPSCCLIETRAFFRAGGFRSHTIPAEDAELWTRIPLLGFNVIKATDEATYVYRKHGTNATLVHPGMPPWTAWLPAAHKGVQPIASVAPAAKQSHPVFNYDRPLVSFVTPVGPGHEALVGDAIESVCAQIDPRWEHIIIDDTEGGSLQEYGVIPYAMRYPHLKWLRSSKLHNVSAARNAGARMARGRFLCFLDADDMLFKEFVRDTLPMTMERAKPLVYTDWIELPEGTVHQAENWDPKALQQRSIMAVTFLHEKSAFTLVGGFDESLDMWEDWDYTVRLSFLGYQGIHVPKPLFSYSYNTGKRREESLEKAKQVVKSDARTPVETQVPAQVIAPPPVEDPRFAIHKAIRPPAVPRAQVQENMTIIQPRLTRPGQANNVGVRYIGTVADTRLYRAPSGRRYRFGSGVHQVQMVMAEDVAHFKAMSGLFELVS